ncbi:P-loop containing nucleoside triphosphate hydrolase protein [Ganoderma leucocontextum]|nr:P-loop containing nucleoside triphosphate hydrolase protein [Ganoderma leucocontextum]
MPLLPGASCRHALSSFLGPLQQPCSFPLSTSPQSHSRRLRVPPNPPHRPPMPPKLRTIQQTLIFQDEVIESQLTQEMLDGLFDNTSTPRRVGLAPIYSNSHKGGRLTRLVVATPTKAIIVQFHAEGKGAKAYQGRELLTDTILCNENVTLLAFDFAKLTIALFADQGLRILNGIDLQSAFGVSGQPALAAIQFAAGDRATVLKENVGAVFAISVHDEKRVAAAAAIACVQQAWVAQLVVTYDGMEERILSAPKINTRDKSETQLRAFARLERGEQRLTLSQPTSVVHEFTAVGTRNQTAQVRAERFQTRFMKDGLRTQRVMVHDPDTNMDFVVDAQLKTVIGRNVVLTAGNSLEGRVIKSIVTEGADGPTNAQRQRSDAVLQALQGKIDLLQNPFLQYIFEPSSELTWPETFPIIDTVPPIVTTLPLNDSQRRAVEHMLLNTNKTRISIIHGPPGTGKTTVIAAFVCSAIAAGGSGIWLVAQSNIAVKNIAEKLAVVGFLNWRLLVSEDFHFGWHEHIYGNIKKNLVRSTEFRTARRDKSLQGVPVILCTLSMLSHPRLNTFTTLNPIKTLVIDEASQIAVGDYISPLQNFPSISKICMIGDHKQLPPYGADGDDNIQSIFEIPHLTDLAVFLSIQYRMPPLIGEVVSDVMYEGQLQSNPDHPVPSTQTSCWFVHAQDSRELQHETSWHNPAERATVLKIAEKLQAEGQEYCIITPYDAQRSFLEKDMKSSGLIWEDKCFNVDSFQGMYIVTSWDFVWERAHETMVGRMAAAWGDEAWVNPEHLTVQA